MTKGRIIGLSNSEEAMWYKLAPEDETLKQIDSIFDIYDSLFREDHGDIYSYKFQIQECEMTGNLMTEDFIGYFIFTEKTAHVILRKTLNWEKYNDAIQKKFAFKK
jgi:hypothetical protein